MMDSTSERSASSSTRSYRLRRLPMPSPRSSSSSSSSSTSRHCSLVASLVVAMTLSVATILFGLQVNVGSLSARNLSVNEAAAGGLFLLWQQGIGGTIRRNSNHSHSNLSTTISKQSTVTAADNKLSHYRGPSLEPYLSRQEPHSTTLPGWLQIYFTWHHHTKASLTPHNYHNGTATKYLILRCLRDLDPKCGGASDRLKLLPFALLVAHQTQRLLLIEWTRPHALEEFLVPNRIDWTVPDWMQIPYQKNTILNTNQVMDRVVNASHSNYNKTFLDMRHQSNDYGMSYYNTHANTTGGMSFHQVYREIWQAVFVPSPAVRDRIIRHPLLQEDYISLHIRTLYARNASAHHDIIHNAVHCAYEMARNQSLLVHDNGMAKTVYIATDSLASTQVAVDYATRFFVRVDHGATHSNDHATGGSSSTTNHHPLHLDRGMDFLNAPRTSRDTQEAYWYQHPPSAFYDVFQDLYLLAGGKCHVYGLGGFGRWGAELSSGSANETTTCVYNHAGRRRKCPVPKILSLQQTGAVTAVASTMPDAASQQ